MRRVFVRGWGLIALTGAAACASATDLTAVKNRTLSEVDPKFTCVDNSPPMRLPADLRVTLPAFGMRTPDDAYAAISESVPGGFAGVFFDDNHYVMTFVDPATADRSRAAIQDAFDSHGFAGSGLVVATAEFRGAHWTFAELDEWFRYVVAANLGAAGNGVSFWDIDERANTVSLGVIDEASRTLLESKLATLNVPCNLVTTRIQPYAVIE